MTNFSQLKKREREREIREMGEIKEEGNEILAFLN